MPFADQAIFSVYDAIGRLVIRQTGPIGGGLTQATINVEKLSAGVYTLKISGTQISKLLPSVKFVKE